MQQNEFLNDFSLSSSLRMHWKLILIGVVFSFLFASIIFSGWPAGLIPHLQYPFVYGGDSNFTLWEIRRLMEGGFFENIRNGYPFGSNFLDYPHSDYGNLLILKLLGLITGSCYSALNLYLLLGFPLAFLSGFLVLKSFALRANYAFVCAMLFAFAPFHFLRLWHVFYTWYFVVPIYFFYGWAVLLTHPSIWPLNRFKKVFKLAVPLILISSFGVYYAFFGCILFIVCGLASSIRNKKNQGFLLAFILTGMTILGVGLNLAPNLINKYENGKNLEASRRIPEETETYSLKIVHLLFPPSFHRVKKLGSYIGKYATYFPPINEAANTSALGGFASLGFLALLVCFFYAALGQQIDLRLRFLSIVVLLFLFISTVGSFNVLFALLVSPLIRGWNRISIFISFAGFTAFFLLLQQNKWLEALYQRKKLIPLTASLSIFVIGLLDQVPPTLVPLTLASKEKFIAERNFIKKIEAAVPKDSAIYQLPYVRFPENGSYINLPDYELLGGYLNSSHLLWSSGGIKGRKGDLFYRSLAQEPINKQLEVLKRLGFSGIYIDRRGFKDGGKDIESKLTELFHSQPTLVRKDKQILFYRITAGR